MKLQVQFLLQIPDRRRLVQDVLIGLEKLFSPEDIMPRFTVGARVRIAEEKTTDRVGTVIEVIPRAERATGIDHYRVELTDGTVQTFSDLQLSPAGSGPTIPLDQAAS